MATVIGIFEDCYKKKKFLPVVKPGSQSRRFTHIDDTVNVCYIAWKKIYVDTIAFLIRKVLLYLRLPSCLKRKIKFLPKRVGERYASALSNMNLSNRVYKYFGKKNWKIMANLIEKQR